MNKISPILFTNTHFYDQQHRLCMEYRNASQNSNTGSQIPGIKKVAMSQDNAVSLRWPGGVAVSNAWLRCTLTVAPSPSWFHVRT